MIEDFKSWRLKFKDKQAMGFQKNDIYHSREHLEKNQVLSEKRREELLKMYARCNYRNEKQNPKTNMGDFYGGKMKVILNKGLINIRKIADEYKR